MPVLGPMLATLMSMSPAGQGPLECQTDSQGVTIRLGNNVHFFVELSHGYPFEDDRSDAPSLAGTLHTVLDEVDAPATDDPERPASAPLEPEEALNPEETGEPEARADVVVAADDVPHAETGWTDPEEAVTLRQIAQADSRDPEAAPETGTESVSVQDVASADDGESAEGDEPAADAPAGVAAPADAESPTGPDLVRADERAWISRFDRVRDEVRDAFRSLQP